MLRTTPPGEDALYGRGASHTTDDGKKQRPADAGAPPGTVQDEGDRTTRGIDYLQLVATAEQQANLYVQQVNRKTWSRAYRAFHNEHFAGSKYLHRDWAHRSKIFVPKTRSATRKDVAAVAASLFGTIDAITCSPGDEADPAQRAAAALMQEVINYRTDRTSGRDAIPWFLTALGARLDSLLTGVCASKQYWKLTLAKGEPEPATDTDGDGNEVAVHELNPESGAYEQKMRDVYVPDIDRPDVWLFAPEHVIVDPAADWTNPAQSAAYLILKYPMRLDDVRRNEEDQRNPWHHLDENILRGAAETTKFDAAAIRRAREFGLDRFDTVNNANEFQIIWVYECFFRIDGEDLCFFSVGNRAYLTDPKPVAEVYPEQNGDRPVIIGYGALESHRIYPMSPAESWQQTQQEINDISNLFLDTLKQNVAPVTKVVRGRNIDLDAVHRRGPNSHILVGRPDDVTFEAVPPIPQAVQLGMERLDVMLDDIAGQFNSGTVQSNRNLNETVGGLRLIAGSANAVQEFDIRLWLETWAEPVLAQLVRLEQYYESSSRILGLAGQRAKLWQRHGMSEITDDLLAHQVTIRINAGLGAGDPQQRLAKFQSAISVAAPLLAQSREFQSGAVGIDIEEIMNEVFGAVGYRDGGKRFIKAQPQPQNGMQQQIAQQQAMLALQKLAAEVARTQAQGKATMLQGLAAVAKVQLGNRALEADVTNRQLEYRTQVHEQHLRAHDQGHRHAMEIADRVRPPPISDAIGSDGGMSAPSSPAQPPSPQSGAPDDGTEHLARLAELIAAPRRRVIRHHRGQDGRISHSEVVDEIDPGPSPRGTPMPGSGIAPPHA
jgi:hypothetical protein